MVKDIHNLRQVLENNTERYLSRLFPEDKEDVRRFTNDLLAQGISSGRVVKYLYSLVSISKMLDKSFKQRGHKTLSYFGIIIIFSEIKIMGI